jgi:hypothetical protein
MMTTLAPRLTRFGRRGELLQGVERGLGAPLLVVTEERVQDDDEQDRDGVAEAREEALVGGRREADDDGDDGGREQREDERVRELLEDPYEGALLFALREAVRSVLFEASLGLGLAQAVARPDLQARGARGRRTA